MLSNNAGIVLDSITFSSQGFDTSFARCPNGAGSFGFQVPTFNALNCAVGINENETELYSAVYPNPAEKILMLKIYDPEKNNLVQVFSTDGKLVSQAWFTGNEFYIDVSHFRSGLYLLKINQKSLQKVQIIH